MKTTLLKIGVAICLLMCLVKLSEFVISRIPPLSEGECAAIKGIPVPPPFVYAKIHRNHILYGYSEVEIHALTSSQMALASFDEVREYLGEKAVCP